MGVRGLSSFVRLHPRMLSDVDLSAHPHKNAEGRVVVIVDHSHWAHWVADNLLPQRFQFPHSILLGGAETALQQRVREWVNFLRRFGVEPVFVCDAARGACEETEAVKWREWEEREYNAQRIRMNLALMCTGRPWGTMWPGSWTGLPDATLAVVKELGCCVVVCGGEAGDELVPQMQQHNA